jgi:hypothetical protein
MLETNIDESIILVRGDPDAKRRKKNLLHRDAMTATGKPKGISNSTP